MKSQKVTWFITLVLCISCILEDVPKKGFQFLSTESSYLNPLETRAPNLYFTSCLLLSLMAICFCKPFIRILSDCL